jgi:hypothetical protein
MQTLIAGLCPNKDSRREDGESGAFPNQPPPSANAMKTLSRLILLIALALPVHAEQAWRQVTQPTLADTAAAFAQPPGEYSAIHWAIWGGPQNKERIISDIDKIHANGGGVYMINNSRGVRPAYLSPEYMDLVKTAVLECKKHGMKVWIEGDCGYPDGFAGGLISEKYPELGMQGIVADAHCTVAAGQTLDIPVPPDTLGIVASPRPGASPAPEPAEADGQTPESPAPAGRSLPVPADFHFTYSVPRGGAGELTVQLPNAEVRYQLTVGEPFALQLPPDTKGLLLRSGGARGARGGERRRGGPGAPATVNTILPLPADGQLKWTAPADGGAWEVAFIRHAFRTSPTRNDNGEDHGATKDSLYTVIDYLNPEATDTYLKVIYEAYESVVGDEFGKTIMGFRADETDYTGVSPWTPQLLATFQAVKGYDFQPYIPQIFGGGRLTPEAQRARADYWDVWSGMFRDNFYKRMEAWCTARNMEFCVHLNHEETMLSGGGDMIHNEGSFWRDMRYVGVPGVDNLNQIRPGIVADFPKIAASAAHVNGHPLVWEEEGGGTATNGKFVADYNMVRGMNFMNIRGLNATNPAAAAIGWYVSRAQYLLANGRPAAQVAFFHPTDSMWLDDREADTVQVKLVTELLEHQIDFDHVDSDDFASGLALNGGEFKNLSGQSYRAVIIPTSTVIQKAVLQRLRDFAAAGGKVIFVGRTPALVAGQSFLHPEPGAPDLSFATLEPTPEITGRVVAALPPPDVKLDAPNPSIKYIHRNYQDGEVYFFFNESDQPQKCTATVIGQGQVQSWDPATGTIQALAGVGPATGSVAVPLAFAPYETHFVVVGPLPNGAH